MSDVQQIFFAYSPRMNKIRRMIDDSAQTDVTVLVTGESGTGKGLVAQAIHQHSQRRAKPFIKVNCAAIPKTLLESELFGFEKGAFTGAHLKKPGKFELANGGTILLNEIGEVHISLQAKLLQVLQNGEFSRLGGNGDVLVNTRVISATKEDLEKCIAEGRFRKDLFFRINVINIKVPPLRERREQVLPLFEYFFHLYRRKFSKDSPSPSARALQILQDYDWPGNIRELENVAKRMLLFQEEDVLQELLRRQAPLPGRSRETRLPSAEENEVGTLNLKQAGREAAEAAEKEMIRRTLQEMHWNRKMAAETLKISYKTLLYKIQKYSLDNVRCLSRIRGESG